jgi:lipopolysaccharide biosynthesis protein
MKPSAGGAPNGTGLMDNVKEPGFDERPAIGSPMTEPVRLIAFFLPQFHPTPENDQWWGKGFTEWRSVVQARPLFRGHYQPHLPADLGFYDLRLPEVRDAQAALARQYGIFGFCYYHYWFNGRRLLGRPLDDVLASGRPDFPFCVCWANEDWTRAWDGRSGERLIGHQYSPEDDRRHVRWLARAFEDERYIRVDGKPLFLVYRARLLPDPLRTTDLWREEAQRLGIGELFLAAVESLSDERGDPSPLGFDAAVEFQPDWKRLGTPLRRGRHWDALRALGVSNRAYRQHRIYDYEAVVQGMLEKPSPSYARFSCVTPSWDNTPRRNADGVVLKGSAPGLYARWLGAAAGEALSGAPERALVFINAWNEWGEGNHLEPSQRWGRAYLEATRDALAAAGAGDRQSGDGIPVSTGISSSAPK